MGEAMGIATNSKGHIFVYTRSALTRGCLSSIRTATTSASLARGTTASSSRTRCASIRRTTSGLVDEGTNMVLKFNPAGRVVMVIGHRPEAVAGALPTNLPTPPATRIYARAPNRCRLGYSGQHLHIRRLYQSSGREVRQERQVPRGRWAASGQDRKLSSSTRRTLSRWMRKATCTYPTARTTACRSSITTSSSRKSTITSAIPGRSAFRRGRTNISSRPTPTRTATARGRGMLPARSTKWNWMGRFVGKLRPRQQGAGRLSGGAHDGLPQSESDHRCGDRILACTETAAEAAGQIERKRR
jgi:hypothetical protein